MYTLMDGTAVQTMEHASHRDRPKTIPMITEPGRYGRIVCPRKGLIDIEICLYCPFLADVQLDGPKPSISCAPPLCSSERELVAYRRLGLLQLAEVLGNVSEACRERGISRKNYYQWKRAFVTKGLPGLINTVRSDRNQSHPPHRTSRSGPVQGWRTADNPKVTRATPARARKDP
ncbi:MAG: helix-turn-helix domain-containing protein [Alicyclobacillus sp.]|nr:helix-turn-helix domain-containing protein [Alicyclobacillus sp.]